ncbi:glycosyltransferase family 2 protein [Fictibacillus sp. KIGAM418]|uniref:Glycosyltransferase family 2 protein n=1 Tax=Fictibacillus marinisediminis TaxID=2878389 RepID=A0A9X2BEZ0_9BACL|nr:glycosyltransferase family 2 protein [Fictibacillus marinisediminis]MCK6259419.1 glycosyltransferase family 2 protein [Fictibacillus marinisediminis]
MNIIIPMAGKGERLKKAGYSLPKMLVECEGEPLFSWALQGLKPFFQKPYKLIFICLKRDLQHTSLLKKIKQYCPYPCTVFTIESWTRGQAETVLKAKQYINNQQPLLIFNCDTYIDIGYHSWSPHQNCADGVVWSFESTEPNLSYIKANLDGTVDEVLEKTPMSPYASTGLYFFKTGASFVQLAEKAIDSKWRAAGEYYVGPLYNELIKQGNTIKMEIVKTCFPLGTTDEIERFRKHFKACDRI